MGLAERVSAGDERHGFHIIHGHTAECFADVASRGQRIGLAVRTFRIDVDQAHLDGAERILQAAIARVALIAKPLAFRTPVNIFFRFPNVFATTGETKCFEPHGLERDIAGENQQVGPRNLAAIFLFNGPKQTARLVEVDVVGPAIQRSKALRA